MSIMRDFRLTPHRLPVPMTLDESPHPHTTVVDCAVYQDGKRLPEQFDHTTAIERVRKSGGFVWIGLHEPAADELTGIAEEFGLHALAVEDAVNAHQRPKVEEYDGVLFAVFKTICYVPHTELTATSEVVDTGQVMVFLGADFVITVRHGQHSGLRAVRLQLEDDPARLALGPSAVLHAVADRVVDDYLLVAAAVQDDIDQIEAAVFAQRRSQRAEQIYQLKREVLEFKRAVVPLLRPLHTLAERDIPLLEPSSREYFRDVEDHLSQVSEQVSSFDELLTSLLQAKLAQVTVAQNEDMRRISAWVAIVAVPTMIVGVYGMNFDYMPELRWKFGYPVVMAVILIACTTLHRGFRRNGWL